MTDNQDKRQQARRAGRYSKMTPCPACGKRRALQPAYSRRDGGPVPNDSLWAGGVLCQQCIDKEGRKP